MASIRESYVKESPTPFSIKETETILDQMKNSICKIHCAGNKGTGFFCKIHNSRKNINVLITANHCLDINYYKNNKEITISYYNKKYIKNINKRKKENDTAIIEIFEDEVENVKFLELDKNIINTENYDKTLNGNTLYAIQYMKEDDDVKVSYGNLKNIEDSTFYHSCSTDKGSSGSPIFLKNNNKLIGIHIGGIKEGNSNNGYFLKAPILEFKSKLVEDEKEKKEKEEKEEKEERKEKKEKKEKKEIIELQKEKIDPTKGIFSEFNFKFIKSNENNSNSKEKKKPKIKIINQENNENNKIRDKFRSLEVNQEIKDKLTKISNNYNKKEDKNTLPPIKNNRYSKDKEIYHK